MNRLQFFFLAFRGFARSQVPMCMSSWSMTRPGYVMCHSSPWLSEIPRHPTSSVQLIFKCPVGVVA